MNRRDFIWRSGLAMAAPGLILTGRNSHATPADDEKMRRIGCTTVCFRPRFPATRADKTPTPNDLTPPLVPKLFAEKLGVHNVELWSRHFPDHSLDYCRRVKAAAADADSRVINLQFDEPGYNLSNPDAAARKQSVQFTKEWMDRAAACGATSLRANTGGSRTVPFNVDVTAGSFAQLAKHGRKIGVKILIENHGGYSSDPSNIAAIIRAVDDPFCRSLPDFGNMPTNLTPQQRAEFLGKLVPTAHLISAKGMVFDADYRHQTYDVGACVRLAEQGGFQGVYSVELWAPGYYPADPLMAIRQMIRTITENMAV